MSSSNQLPPGQWKLDEFPRFGLSKYAKRYQTEFAPLHLTIQGEINQGCAFKTEDLQQLNRVDQVSDFHCVTTWSVTDLQWSGYRFRDFFEQLLQPQAQPKDNALWLILRSQDGFRARLPLQDLLADDVLLADRLNGEPLTAKHGAPLRLVAPAHYGYKNVKHLKSIEFCLDETTFKPTAFAFMDHPRARVAEEERGRKVSGRILRILYKPLVKPTIRQFKKAMRERT